MTTPGACRQYSVEAINLVRPRVRGKFIFAGDEKLYVRGVTYGTFRPGEDSREHYDPQVVERDFAQMRESGINALRIYTVPPRWLLDAAERHGLRVMVGLPWEQHIAFLDDRRRAQEIIERVRRSARECAGHPALLCFTIGNEIPSPIVRWHGRRRVERFLYRLYRAVKREDPEALVTYVNYPSTEYLQLPFVDFLCFNVYLESEERLAAYLARLQSLAGDRPVVMAEVGLDSRRNGEAAQAAILDWQIRTVFAAGCAGAFVFAWTDEWWRGGFDIEDWDFGLTTRDRKPKPALAAVSRAFADVPFPANRQWPRVSVVVCSYNGAGTIRDCLDGLLELDYPNYEVIVVNDGSIDDTARIACEYPFRLISTANSGLSSARNTGAEAATGEIVAYTDDDARPDSHWLKYLAHTFVSGNYAGVGGPNIAPGGDGWIADCVANAPGGPVHVLVSDTEAEHIPGCNMAFRRDVLQQVGGCDPVYHAAGDDVDLCWRVQEAGGRLGFSPSAFVWHHRRNSVRMYWKQQQGYGKAEALLEEKWPEKYNPVGHLTWMGRLYGKGLTQSLLSSRSRVYQGTWGSGLFQSIYQPAPGMIISLPLMPEWYLIIISLAALAALGVFWTPLLLALPLLLLAVGALFAQAGLSAAKASFTVAPRSRFAKLKLWALTTALHLMQPLARLRGRLRWGLTPWRKRGVRGFSPPWPRTLTHWSEERWQSADEKLRALEKALQDDGVCVLRGGDFDRWDLEVRGGLLGATRLRLAVEDHGANNQLARFRLWPKCSPKGVILILLFVDLSVMAMADEAWIASAILGADAALFALRMLYECAAATATAARTLRAQEVAESEAEIPLHTPSVAETAASAPEPVIAMQKITPIAAAAAAASPISRRNRAVDPVVMVSPADVSRLRTEG